MGGAREYLKYLKGTIDYGITYTHQEDITLEAQCNIKGEHRQQAPPHISIQAQVDASHADDKETSKSTTGYIFRMANGPISWQTKTQETVALSTMESEYIAACAATQEALWIKTVLEELNVKVQTPVLIGEDNMSTINFSEHPRSHRRTKHILKKYHFVRKQVTLKNIKLQYVPTENNIADIFRKPLWTERFQYLRNYLVQPVLPLY